MTFLDKNGKIDLRERVNQVNLKIMQIICNQNLETGEFLCNIPFPTEQGIEYNNILDPESSMIFIIIVIWFFAWTLERIFYFLINRVKKAKYDS